MLVKFPLQVKPLDTGNYKYDWTISDMLNGKKSYKIPETLQYDSLYKFCIQYLEELGLIGYARDSHICYYLRLPTEDSISKGTVVLELLFLHINNFLRHFQVFFLDLMFIHLTSVNQMV